MKSALAVLVTVLGSLVVGQAQASNGLYLTPDYSGSNVAEAHFRGYNNSLFATQLFDSAGGANRLQVNIDGNLNGGPLGAVFGDLILNTGLIPGQLIQSGHDNSMAVSIVGSQNLFAASQIGSHNLLTASVIGNNNQSQVSQSGSGNSLSFTQNGSGNRHTVIQRSY